MAEDQPIVEVDSCCCDLSQGQPITKLGVSTSDDEREILGKQGFKIIPVNLNSGTSGSKVFLWYKQESGVRPITRIQFSFTSEMEDSLRSAGYEEIKKNLNIGTKGDPIFLWHFSGELEDDVPIMDVKVTTRASQEPGLMKNGYERLGCDLNRSAGGDYVYLWVKRQQPTYIYEVTACIGSDQKNLFELGYTRVDENVNLGNKGTVIFLWYRRSTDLSKALTSLRISINLQEDNMLQEQGYQTLGVNLNKGAGGSDVYLWIRKDESCEKIQGINLLINPQAKIEYEKAGINVSEENLNDHTGGVEMHLAYK